MELGDEELGVEGVDARGGRRVRDVDRAAEHLDDVGAQDLLLAVLEVGVVAVGEVGLGDDLVVRGGRDRGVAVAAGEQEAVGGQREGLGERRRAHDAADHEVEHGTVVAGHEHVDDARGGGQARGALDPRLRGIVLDGHASELREAAVGGRDTAKRVLHRGEELLTGHVDDDDGVVERERGPDGEADDARALDGVADAAAVLESDVDAAGRDGVSSEPQGRVGRELTEVGRAGPDVGARAVEREVGGSDRREQVGDERGALERRAEVGHTLDGAEAARGLAELGLEQFDRCVVGRDGARARVDVGNLAEGVEANDEMTDVRPQLVAVHDHDRLALGVEADGGVAGLGGVAVTQ